MKASRGKALLAILVMLAMVSVAAYQLFLFPNTNPESPSCTPNVTLEMLSKNQTNANISVISADFCSLQSALWNVSALLVEEDGGGVVDEINHLHRPVAYGVRQLMTFVDRDADNSLSSGDYFLILTNPNHAYLLRVIHEPSDKVLGSVSWEST